VAEVLVWSDLMGRPEQGVWRVPVYLKRLKRGLISSPCSARAIAARNAVVVIDGGDGFGQVVGRLAMNRAIDLAAQYGVGVAAVRRSNHFGPASYYVNLAAERGCVALAISNATPRVAPAGSSVALLGTNPIALGAPRREHRAILVDLATSASAGATVRRAAEAGKELRSGVARDVEGREVRNAHEALSGVLQPMGGSKGFALSIMVEILSGVITGAAVSRDVASIYEDFSRPNGAGHVFIALDVETLMPRAEYFNRIERLVGFILSADRVAGSDEPVIPGERRWRMFDKHMAEGLELDERTCHALGDVARELGASTPW
jgi:LDH2 family malate/lactate/ureidoglycolate dehydrogenase